MFAYLSVTTAIGVSVFAMQLRKTNVLLHISLYKRNNVVKCCNTCFGSVLFQYLCYSLTESMDIRFQVSLKNVVFYVVFKLWEFITKLIHAINFLFKLDQFSIKK